MVNVDPSKYSGTADAFDGLSQQALNYAMAARGTLGGFGGMAGTDPGGESFSAAYDEMATAALQVLYDIAVATRGLDRAIMATGGTHAQANANAEGIVYDAASAFVLRAPIGETSVSPPPTAFGGRPDTMVQGLDSAAAWVWDQILNLVGTLFPDGDPEKLEEAGTAWQTILGDISSLRSDIRLADNGLLGMESAEISAIQTKVSEFADGLTTFLSADQGIGAIDDICREYAQQIRDTLEETRQMIAQLVIEVIATAGISFALSFVTFGAAAAAGSGTIAIRIGVIASRIASLVSKCVGTASRLAVRLRAIVAGMRAAGAAFPKLTRVGIDIVSGTSATMLAETVQGGEANYGAAFLSGLAGGGITSAITAPFGAQGSKFLVQALANGSGNAGGSVVDMSVRGEDISAQSVAMSAGLGVVMSSRLPSRRTPTAAGGNNLGTPVTPSLARTPGRSNPAATGESGSMAVVPPIARTPGRRNPLATGEGGEAAVVPPITRTPSRQTPTAANPGGGNTPDLDAQVPAGAGGGASGSSSTGGGAPRTDYDGPSGQGGDVAGNSADGGGAPSNHGEAPAEQEIVVTSTGDDATPAVTPDSSASTSDAPVSDAPVSDAPGSDAPASDAPASDAPVSDAPASDAPVSNTPDAPASDAPASDALPADVPAAGSPSNDVVLYGDGGPSDAGSGPGADDAVPSAAADHGSVAESTNPKVSTLFDADGTRRTFQEWDVAGKKEANLGLNTRKGEFGELHAQNQMESEGWARIDNGADGSKNPNSPGLDGVYTRTGADGNPRYAVIEAKYNTSRMGNTLDGRQMSQGWIHGDVTQNSRLEDALRDNQDAFNSIDRATLESGVVRVLPDGEVRVSALDADGRVVPGTESAFDAPAAILGETLAPARVQELADQGYHVAFFDGRAYESFYAPKHPYPSLGPTGGKFWVMPLEDGAHVSNAADAYRATGASPAMTAAYTGFPPDADGNPILSQKIPDEDRGVFGVLFSPDPANPPLKPTPADSNNWPHFLENSDPSAGRTAVLMGEGPNAGYLTNPHIREFVINGGQLLGKDGFVVQIVDGAWTVVRVVL